MELREYLRILRKRRWVVAIALLACLSGAAAATVAATPVYEARAKLFVGSRQIATSDIQTGVERVQLSQQLLKSYANIIRLRSTAEKAVQRDDIPIAPKEISEDLRAEPVLDTQLIDLSYESTSPALAQRVVNAVAAAFVAESAKLEGPSQPGAEPAVKVSVVEEALRPTQPVRPRPVRNMALAFVLGMMIGIGFAFLADYLDTTLKSPEEAEEIAGVPVLAAIPKIDTGSDEVYLERDPQSTGAEAFRKLRTSIQFLGVDTPVRTILVTSSFPREGKTTTALNLAASFAQAGMRTILVEADLRRPVLHKLFLANDSSRGLTTALIGRIPLEQAIFRTPIRNLAHIPAGAIPPNPAELLASQHWVDTLESLQQRADIVVVDAPPLLPVADSSALAPRVDGVLLVARAGHTHRDRFAESAALIGKVGGRLLGSVLNFIAPRDGKYGYYYGYGYAATEASPIRKRHPEAVATNEIEAE